MKSLANLLGMKDFSEHLDKRDVIHTKAYNTNATILYA
jgi:hypothetical protein